MKRKHTNFLKEPLSGDRFNLISAVLVFVASIFVNAYFQVTSFSGIVLWFLKVSGQADAQQRLAEILSQSSTTVEIKIAFGLLMTVFVMVFLLLSAYMEGKEKNIKYLFERACSTMLVPVLLMLVAALLMNVSLAAGVVFGIAAAADCMAVIVSAGKKAKMNGYIIITIVTAFFLITVVLLTRNHLITMMG